MQKNFFFLLMMALFYSCNISSDTNKDVIRIDMQQNAGEQAIENRIKAIRIVPLETNEESLISQIRKIKQMDSQWYVLEYNDSPIKRFDSDGRFLNTIGQKGQGPGEFVQISDFAVSRNANDISIFAWNGNKKCIRMDSNNRLLSETDMLFPFTECYRMSDSDYLLHLNNGVVADQKTHYLYRINDNYEIKEAYFPKKAPHDIMYSFEQTYFATGSNNDILYLREYNDTVYSINPSGGIAAKYHLDFGKVWYSERFLSDFHERNFMEIHQELNRRGYPKFIAYSENPDYLCVKYTRQQNKEDVDYITLYSKKKKKADNFQIGKSSFAALFSNLQAYNAPYFTSFISASDFLDMASSLSEENPFYKEIKSLAGKINEGDNPLLVLFEFKQIDTLVNGESLNN